MNGFGTFTSNSEGSNSSSHSDEEAIQLASEKPKKRAGRRVFKETRHPVYRGVRRRDKDKWVCEVRVPNNNKLRIWLGTHSTPEKAARAHDVAALALRGKSACLNFADSAWQLPVPASTDPDEIRRVAMEAVEAFDDDNENQHGEVCSSMGTVMGSEAHTGMSMELGRHVNGVEVGVSAFEDQILFSMADEPLRSPPAAYSLGTTGWDWREELGDHVDNEVSLWSFSI
ncbi:dehydration-responsive element-binding protein 1E-like [Neltuma alba]|uniref:dehydration-responsive element-binding protein 1E-like n=1 Tax=Neltuma alba TaxID=207710 RepID=UPI0010A4A67F|nr:dehydration-responsive element-binding protein 1E-like [Prosopis alba]